MNRYIIPMEELTIGDVPETGGKNASLGEMIRELGELGVKVPGGFATTADAYRDFLAQSGLADRINGVLDDLIFVAIDSCTVEDIVHSGRPFEKDDHLTFRATEYVVAAGTLKPGQTYSMYVEHALLPNTQKDYGMPAFATFAASTYMDFQTVGETDPSYCDEPGM